MRYTSLFLISLIFISNSLIAQEEKEQPFTIVAFGDMPYVLPDDYARFQNLIDVVNTQHQIFNVHVGDIKSSSTLCSDEYYKKIKDYFQQFRKPLIYTPGDNEWTDCNKVKAGSYDPEERLDAIRKVFFSSEVSFGAEKIKMITQSQNQLYSKYVENRMWHLNGVTFGTVHLVGTNNYFLPESKDFNREFFERDNANIAWLNEIFEQAQELKSYGIFLFTQADMFTPEKAAAGSFDRFLRELKKLTILFNKPVIQVHGDSHKFIVDKPLLRDDATKKVLVNFTRIQVFGEADMHAVKITITPTSPGFFQTEQLIIPGN